ncbi:serine/threonine protein kinase [Kibdelosporangium philippinense]|uniref:mitogen-activated protein kinase kinase n=1 Tax=Kibdelosporangium philippinense TaxID=211113 RepID=A0ABS8ZDE9_9PSEU|nr:serine/threonine-protein kinase [Kibdelosporangium philippinense]MCE7005866.1 serine/threonine protein kinase [Kibdelosporangium philippinense]
MVSEAEVEQATRVIAGRYRLVSVIGHGSMGTVWRAYDEFLHRPVAVKEIRLPPGMPQGQADEVRERTLREARAIGVLSHPNVVTLHDIAHENGDPYVVMELVPGSSLAHLLRSQGPLDTTQAAAVADAVAAALQAAHQAGITHRDVKPANVLIATDGRIKLADFGIAHNISENTLTKTGITLGSPAYIAPEVASGSEVTNNADLWSLGATLFATIEGHAPYDPEGDVIATLLEVVNGDVPKPSNTGPMAKVVSSLMIKEPTDRMTLAEVRRRMYGLLPEPGTSPFTLEDITEAESFIPAPKQPEPEPVVEPEVDSTGPSLADDPGPLPFAPSQPMLELDAEPTARIRRGVPRSLIYAAAVLLFLAAAGGGFAATRYAGGKSLLPTQPTVIQQPVVQPPEATPPGEFAVRNGDAATLKGTKGGGFSIKVPPGWDTFVEERQPKNLPVSTRVHYVSPDGKYELTIERFPDFYPSRKINQFKDSVQSTWPRDAFVASDPLILQYTNSFESGQYWKYNTVDAGVLRRTTYSNLMPMNDADLWVVSLTVPTVEEDTGKGALFDKIAPSFTLTP